MSYGVLFVSRSVRWGVLSMAFDAPSAPTSDDQTSCRWQQAMAGQQAGGATLSLGSAVLPLLSNSTPPQPAAAFGGLPLSVAGHGPTLTTGYGGGPQQAQLQAAPQQHQQQPSLPQQQQQPQQLPGVPAAALSQQFNAQQLAYIQVGRPSLLEASTSVVGPAFEAAKTVAVKSSSWPLWPWALLRLCPIRFLLMHCLMRCPQAQMQAAAQQQAFMRQQAEQQAAQPQQQGQQQQPQQQQQQPPS